MSRSKKVRACVCRLPENLMRKDKPQRDRRNRIEQRDARAIEFLEDLADHSAGRVFRSEVTNLKKSFALIAEGLRHQYRLGFYPGGQAKAGTWHSLSVEVARPDVVVRSRKGFLY